MFILFPDYEYDNEIPITSFLIRGSSPQRSADKISALPARTVCDCYGVVYTERWA
jgi:hypothetical protein